MDVTVEIEVETEVVVIVDVDVVATVDDVVSRQQPVRPFGCANQRRPRAFSESQTDR